MSLKWGGSVSLGPSKLRWEAYVLPWWYSHLWLAIQRSSQRIACSAFPDLVISPRFSILTQTFFLNQHICSHILICIFFRIWISFWSCNSFFNCSYRSCASCRFTLHLLYKIVLNLEIRTDAQLSSQFKAKILNIAEANIMEKLSIAMLLSSSLKSIIDIYYRWVELVSLVKYKTNEIWQGHDNVYSLIILVQSWSCPTRLGRTSYRLPRYTRDLESLLWQDSSSKIPILLLTLLLHNRRNRTALSDVSMF